MKNCNKCKIDKPISDFGKRKDSKDGLKNYCIKCETIRLREYCRTKDGLISRTYANQVMASKKRNHNAPEYSKKELITWVNNQHKFNVLFKEWEDSNYNKELHPSIDRKEDTVGYSLDNIQIMTWKENSLKNYRDRVDGKKFHGGNAHIKVKQILNNVVINEFVSLREAERETGVPHGNISKCCQKNKGYKTAGGFQWEAIKS